MNDCSHKTKSISTARSYRAKQPNAKRVIQEYLDSAEITINGSNPWDIQVHNEAFYPLVLQKRDLGLGESYMAKWWDAGSLDSFFAKILSADLDKKVTGSFLTNLHYLYYKLFNQQSPQKSLQVGKKHYDIGNDLFEIMLDSKLNYSCGYWPNAESLEQAQMDKLHLTCQKLNLAPKMKLLDIGCGWGALSAYASENYGVSVDGITISKNQLEFAKSRYPNLPINFAFQDYRDIKGQYDRIVSIGMFEHVGYKNYKTYMNIIHRSLSEHGIFLLHTIGTLKHNVATNPWIAKYIFPNGQLPTMQQIVNASQNLFVMEDWHNFGADYDKTLMSWCHNFEKHWDSLKDKYDETFYRMWRYYLLSCAGAFRSRKIHLWQIVFSKNGIIGGFQAPR